MSGTGKTTVLRELEAMGYATVDTDDDGWAVEVPIADGSAMEQVWVADRMTALLADAPDVVVSGCASNQGDFYDRFDAVILLSAPLPVMLARIGARTDNAFGSTAADNARIEGDLRDVESLLRRTSTAEIHTDRPLPDVVAAVLEQIRRVASAG
jgi:dephospho-CoA kinase